MKLKLLLLLLFLNAYAFAQIPNDFIMKYSFTNGSLQNEDAGTTGDFTQTGTTLITVTDRGGTPNDAIQLNQDSLESSQLNAETGNISEMTISFWINPTNTAASTQKEILRMRSALFGREFIITENKAQNQISFTAKGRNTSTNAILSCTFNQTQASLFDNNWHHIVYRAYLFNAQNLTFQLYIDGVLKTDTANFGCGLNNINNSVPPQFLTRPRLSLSTLSTIKYDEQIDDIYFYKRALTNAEILALYNDNTLNVDTFQIKNNVSDFEIYPNPTHQLLNISTEEKIDKIEIYTILGTKVLESHQLKINVSNLSKGVYIIKIATKNNQLLTKRFIKQ